MPKRFAVAPPRPTNTPSIAYEYVDTDDDQQPGEHRLRCGCHRWTLTTTDAKAATRAAQSHLGEHLRRSIYDPQKGDDE